MFSRKSLRLLRPQALSLYRKCMRIIMKLERSHQKTWYDYIKLKFEENRGNNDETKIKKLFSEANEQLDWVQTVIARRKIS